MRPYSSRQGPVNISGAVLHEQCSEGNGVRVAGIALIFEQDFALAWDLRGMKAGARWSYQVMSEVIEDGKTSMSRERAGLATSCKILMRCW